MPFMTEAMLVNMVQSQFGRVPSTAPASYALAVVTVPPLDDLGTGLAEPNDASYARLVVANNTTNFVVDRTPSLAVTNGAALTFAMATEEWGSVMGLALYNTAATPVFLGYMEFTNPLTISKGDTLVVPPQGFRLNLDLTPVSAYVQEQAEMFILTAPDGAPYALKVSSTGALSTVRMSGIIAPPASPVSFAYDSPTRTFTWQPPTHFATNSPITSYTLWRSVDGDGDFTILDQDATSYVLPDGESGIYYLTTDNPAGSSSPSALVTVF